MTLLMLLVGVVAVFGVALRNESASQTRHASLLEVYLRDDASQADVDRLAAALRRDGRVVSVHHVTREEALSRAHSRPGLGDLSRLVGNPFPASLDVQVRTVPEVAAVAATVGGDPAVDPAQPTSYDPETYRLLQRLIVVAGVAGLGLVILVGLVAVAVTANSIRAALLARRSEVRVMHLVGASPWLVRGPFMLEGAFTGAVAGSVAGVTIVGLFVLGALAGSATFVQFLPGVSVPTVIGCVVLLVSGGAGLGSLSSLLGLRGLHV
jgi:cell division protein FtsX